MNVSEVCAHAAKVLAGPKCTFGCSIMRLTIHITVFLAFRLLLCFQRALIRQIESFFFNNYY